jgi:hypothetical protein
MLHRPQELHNAKPEPSLIVSPVLLQFRFQRPLTLG